MRSSDLSSDVCSSERVVSGGGEGNGGHLVFPSLSRGRAGWGWLVLVRWRFGRCRGGWETHPHPTRPARRSAPGVRATCAAVPRRQAALTPLKGRAFWRLLGGLELGGPVLLDLADQIRRSEEHTSELQSLMRISDAVFCLKKTNT